MDSGGEYPRALSSLERELLLWILPDHRAGYADYRRAVERWRVVAAGRRGEGNHILAETGWRVDVESALPPLFAFGEVRITGGSLSVAVRERLGNQIEFEIVGTPGVDLQDLVRKGKRWTYSDWLPTQACPSCGKNVREVLMRTAGGRFLDLSLCATDRRIWVYDGQSGVIALLPVTGFYNELMLQRGVRDPSVALDPKRLFGDLDLYDNEILARAFLAYNTLRNRVALDGPLVFERKESPGWFRRVIKAFAGKRNAESMR